MKSTTAAAALLLAGSAPLASALRKGFNIGAQNADGTCKSQAQWAQDFKGMKNLPGNFKDVRVYAASDCNTLELAVPAAKDAGVQLLVGIWTEDDAHYSAEKAALEAAITKYGVDWISAVSVGSEDLYRGDTNAGRLAEQVYDVRGMISQDKYGGKGIWVGHVDTYNAWNASSADLINAVDFVGVDAYPYWQGVTPDQGQSTFQKAIDETLGFINQYNPAAKLWITETGWPTAGPNFGNSVANKANAKTFWDAVLCKYASQYSIWWYTLHDTSTEAQDFGVVDDNFGALFDLNCPSS